jgi:CubicO group peptidase (beta-lactamase class C family)
VNQTAGLPAVESSRALFDIGSAAKSITAAAVLLLEQRGWLDLSASISKYLPDVPPADRTITAAQLLSHSSGLPENFASDQRRLSKQKAIQLILNLPRHSTHRFAYSNAGYTLLAAIVEQVTHQPFRVFVEHQLLAPSGMRSTGWYGEQPSGVVPVHGHIGGRNTGAAGTQAPASWATLGAGGMTSTAADMMRWLQALQAHRILDAATTKQMFTPREPIGQPGASAAYGWVVGTTTSGPIRVIGGDTDYGYTSDLRFLPKASLLTVALSGSDESPANQLGHDLETSET